MSKRIRPLGSAGLCLAAVLACGESDLLPDAGDGAPRMEAAGGAAGAEGALDYADVDAANVSQFVRQPGRTDWSGGDPERGGALYLQACWICHGAVGKGHGPAASSLNPKPRDFREGRFYIDANANDETGEPIDLARVILVGTEAFGGSELMQGWHQVFTIDEVRDLVAYVQSLSRGQAKPQSSG